MTGVKAWQRVVTPLAFLLTMYFTFLILFYIPRSDFYGLIGAFLVLFGCFYFIVNHPELFSLHNCIALAVSLRLLALFSIPSLSDDYFRFIWDGVMNNIAVGAFRLTPQEFIRRYNGDQYMQMLFRNMNSQEYHSVYPPVMQIICSLATKLFPRNLPAAVITMKGILVLCELGTVAVLQRIMVRRQLNPRLILWYVLNPVIIIELCGNLHFEGVMLLFVALFLLLLQEKKWWLSGICWAVAICTKMIPLMFAPLLLKQLGVKKSCQFFLPAGVTFIFLWLPFYNSHMIGDIHQSVRLFFHLFEFNAGIWYAIRSLGLRLTGENLIEQVAPALGVISTILILVISWFSSTKLLLEEKLLWIIFVYYAFATMVHPWYISILVLLSIFGRFRFPIWFSFLILLSYFPYSLPVYDEDVRVIAIEYGLLGIYMFYEFRNYRKTLANLPAQR